MLRKFFVATTATMLGLFSTAQIASVATDTVAAPAPEAEEPKPSLTITGSADAYYKYDFSKTKANTFTSFTGTHNNFSLGMASVKLEHKGNKVGAVLDLGFGPRAKEFAYADDGITQAISTTPGSLYTISFWLNDNSGNSTFSRVSTNGNVTNTGGNGIDLLVYAGVVPTLTSVPEPASLMANLRLSFESQLNKNAVTSPGVGGETLVMNQRAGDHMFLLPADTGEVQFKTINL